jgi:MoxR-like ATPase
VLRGDPVVDVEDVLAVAGPALRHRLVLSYRAEADGVGSLDLVQRIVREQRSRLKI